MKDSSTTVACPLPFTSLIQRGWTVHSAAYADADTVLSEVRRIGDLLGTRVHGRTGALEELLHPQHFDKAHPRSLSARYGLASFPLHAEQSHRHRPCRYLLLACIDSGSSVTETRLFDWRTLAFSPDELDFLESAPILVRSGRRSFYSTVLPPDRSFLRCDPGCLEAVNERGRAALKLLQDRLALSSPEVHQWCRGDILIIDNWRILHGRGPASQDSARCLARILIDAE